MKKTSKWIDGKSVSSSNKPYDWSAAMAEKKPKIENRIRLTVKDLFVDGKPISIPPESRIHVNILIELDGQPFTFSLGKNRDYDTSVTIQDFDVC